MAALASALVAASVILAAGLAADYQGPGWPSNVSSPVLPGYALAQTAPGHATAWTTATAANQNINLPVAGYGTTTPWGDGQTDGDLAGSLPRAYAAPANHTVIATGGPERFNLDGGAGPVSVDQRDGATRTGMDGAIQGSSDMVYGASGAPGLSAATGMRGMVLFDGDEHIRPSSIPGDAETAASSTVLGVRIADTAQRSAVGAIPEADQAEQPAPEDTETEQPPPEDAEDEQPAPEDTETEQPPPEDAEAEQPAPEDTETEQPPPEDAEAEQPPEDTKTESLTPLTITLKASSNPAEEGSTVTITASYEGESTDPVSVALNIDDQSSASSDDYVLESTTINIPSNQTSGSTTLSIIDDDIAEGTESLVMRAVHLSSQATLTLDFTDNDAAPEGTETEQPPPEDTETEQPAPEDAPTGQPPGDTPTVQPPNGNQTGQPPGDTPTVQPPNGNQTGQPPTPPGDTPTVQPPNGNQTGQPPNDAKTESLTPLKISLRASNNTAEEGSTVTITASYEGESTDPVSVVLNIDSQSSASSDDYVLESTTIVIPANQTSGSTTLSIVDDDIAEGTESLMLRAAHLSSLATLTLDFTDNDAAPEGTETEQPPPEDTETEQPAPEDAPTGQPPGDTPTVQPPNGNQTGQPPGGTPTVQPPNGNQTGQPPGGTPTVQPPNGNQTGQPPGGTPTVQPPNGNQTGQPPGGTPTVQPPNGNQTGQPPGGTPTVQPPNGNQTGQPPGGTPTVQPPNGNQTGQPPGGTPTVQPPNGNQTGQPPGGTPTVQPPNGNQTGQPPGGTPTVQPPNGNQTGQPPGGTPTVQPPNGNQTGQPPDDAKTESLTPLKITLKASDNPAEEGSTVTITASYEGESTDPVSVVLNIDSQSSASSDDYVLESTTIVIPANQTSGSTTLSIVDDDIAEGTESLMLRAAHLSSQATLTLDFADNDAASVILDKEQLDITVNSTGTYTLVLGSKPAGNVTVTAASTAVTVEPSTHTFDHANWNTPRTFTVLGTSPGTDTITHAISDSTAVEYSTLNIGSISVRINADAQYDLVDIVFASPGDGMFVPLPDTFTTALNVTAESDNDAVVTVMVTGNHSGVVLTPIRHGGATISVVADWGGGVIIRDGFAVTVKSIPTISKIIPPTELTVTQVSNITNLDSYFDDADGDALTFTSVISGGGQGVAALNYANNTITIAGLSSGSVMVEVTAWDPDGNNASQSFAARVYGVVSFGSGEYALSESGNDTLLDVQISGRSGNVSVPVIFIGESAAYADYTITNPYVIFNSSDAVWWSGFVPHDDDLVEHDETMTVGLVPPTGYVAGEHDSATVTITDDDRTDARIAFGPQHHNDQLRHCDMGWRRILAHHHQPSAGWAGRFSSKDKQRHIGHRRHRLCDSHKVNNLWPRYPKDAIPARICSV